MRAKAVAVTKTSNVGSLVQISSVNRTVSSPRHATVRHASRVADPDAGFTVLPGVFLAARRAANA